MTFFAELALLENNTITGNGNLVCSGKPDILVVTDCGGPSPEVTCTCCQLCCVDAELCNDFDYLAQLDPIWERSYTRITYDFAAPAPTNPSASPSASPTASPAPSLSPSYSSSPSFSSAPSQSPGSREAIQNYLVANAISDAAAFSSSASPQSQALDFIAGEAPPIPSDPTSPQAYKFMERYVLSVLYFSTNGDSWHNHYSFNDNSLDTCSWNARPITVSPPDFRGVFCNVENGPVEAIRLSKRGNRVCRSSLRCKSLTNLIFVPQLITAWVARFPKSLVY